MRENAICTKKRRFGTRFREKVITNPFLSENDAKRNLRGKRRFGPRFRQTVITNTFLSQNAAKRNLSQKRRFGTIFRVQVITNPQSWPELSGHFHFLIIKTKQFFPPLPP